MLSSSVVEFGATSPTCQVFVNRTKLRQHDGNHIPACKKGSMWTRPCLWIASKPANALSKRTSTSFRLTSLKSGNSAQLASLRFSSQPGTEGTFHPRLRRLSCFPIVYQGWIIFIKNRGWGKKGLFEVCQASISLFFSYFRVLLSVVPLKVEAVLWTSVQANTRADWSSLDQIKCTVSFPGDLSSSVEANPEILLQIRDQLNVVVVHLMFGNGQLGYSRPSCDLVGWLEYLNNTFTCSNAARQSPI